ncbi:thiamine-phosphate kinase [Anopheles sinensis]|uniref:Thiamine-phosphate kinase n=1 Tax=Anopheles sinensis TaxID=74873 RepID=A0A084W153_ANOSI|nr:thiamine-phosphate kinase [Anopheles sinensis]
MAKRHRPPRQDKSYALAGHSSTEPVNRQPFGGVWRNRETTLQTTTPPRRCIPPLKTTARGRTKLGRFVTRQALKSFTGGVARRRLPVCGMLVNVVAGDKDEKDENESLLCVHVTVHCLRWAPAMVD